MRLIALIFAAALLLPSPSWGQNAPVGPQYDAAKRSIQQAITNSYKAKWEREAQEEWRQVSTLDKIRAFLNQPANQLDSWIRIAQNLGIPVGTKLSPPSAKDTGYCHDNPQALICRSTTNTEGTGGGGAWGTWGDQECKNLDFTLDVGGNIIVPAITLPDPRPYKFGEQLWQAYTPANLMVNEPWAALKVNFHMTNAPEPLHLQYAPVYAVQFCAAASCSYGIYASRPAYYSGGTRMNASFRSFTVGINPNSIAWNQSTGYGDPPPPGYECPDGIGSGQFNQHWKACIRPPTAWNIPAHGVIIPGDLKKWAEGSNSANCFVSDEFIRLIADRAYQAACADGSCDIPYSRVEPEDVRNGGQRPTIRDTGNVGSLPDGNGEGTPNPQPTPTESPSTGPDWTDPGTVAPNPQAPDLNLDWDWGLPAISIDLGSHQCPTYSADFFGHKLVLDSHCPFIEQNRALISAMMLILFTIAAGIIVLRA